MPELLDFGKHTSYVWGSFGLTFVVLLWNILAANRSLATLTRKARRRLAATEETR